MAPPRSSPLDAQQVDKPAAGEPCDDLRGELPAERDGDHSARFAAIHAHASETSECQER
jgi:hypothetical protein